MLILDVFQYYLSFEYTKMCTTVRKLGVGVYSEFLAKHEKTPKKQIEKNEKLNPFAS